MRVCRRVFRSPVENFRPTRASRGGSTTCGSRVQRGDGSVTKGPSAVLDRDDPAVLRKTRAGRHQGLAQPLQSSRKLL